MPTSLFRRTPFSWVRHSPLRMRCRYTPMKVASLTILLWSLAEVHSQTFPYVSFMGQILANHSYVDLGVVGYHIDGSDSVQCHTDLTTCCRTTEGNHRGDWYFPNGSRLPFSDDIYEIRNYRRVDLRHRLYYYAPTRIFIAVIFQLMLSMMTSL